MKLIQKYVGQSHAKASVNEVITDYKAREAAGENLPTLRPFYLSGPAGMGKSEFAKAVADAFDWQFLKMPVASGIRALNNVMSRASSIDEDTGIGYAVPSVILCDEFPSLAKTAQAIIKDLTEGKPDTFTREGTLYVRDMSRHLWIFASNEKVDKAIVSRSENLPMASYNKGERKQIIQLNCDREIETNALEFLADRVKQTARECKALGVKMARQGHQVITLPIAKEVCRTAQIWPGGLTEAEVKLLAQLAKDRRMVGAAVIAMLLGKQGAGAKSEAEEVAIYLSHVGLLSPSDSGTKYGIAKGGISYLETITKLQKERAAKVG